jgi:hypothetical protein
MIEYRFRVPSATVFTLYSYSKALKYPTVASLSLSDFIAAGIANRWIHSNRQQRSSWAPGRRLGHVRFPGIHLLEPFLAGTFLQFVQGSLYQESFLADAKRMSPEGSRDAMQHNCVEATSSTVDCCNKEQSSVANHNTIITYKKDKVHEIISI